MARNQAPLTAYVLFFEPPGTESFDGTDLRKLAAGIPGVKVLEGHDGKEAALFRLATSGHVLLYDRAGHLRFSGGITKSRGHSGDNAGRDAIVAFLNHGSMTEARTSVFGCSLWDSRSSISEVQNPIRGIP